MSAYNEQLFNLLEDLHANLTAGSVSQELSEKICTLVEKIFAEKAEGQIQKAIWHKFLELTGHHTYLESLPSRDKRYTWADTACRVIELSGFTLLDMLNQRVEAYPDRILFQDMTATKPALWSYSVIAERLRSMAGVFYKTKKTPRVAILSNNCVDSACADLACLLYDILDTPLNVHFDPKTIAWIIEQLNINIVLADTDDNISKLKEARAHCALDFSIFSFDVITDDQTTVKALREACIELIPAERESLLQNRRRFSLDEVCTVMFTSGSTGKPKGVSFSQFNLVSKRFCRAAALPHVGDNEILLCYLPLFHTFGRYFEMLGSIYWAGTYVFPGNPSVETLLQLFKNISPTGLISIPLRWTQIQEECLELMEAQSDAKSRKHAFRNIVGQRLRWGLSAAGYLSPKAFDFFNNNGVQLCSGFGMTEATGGITMTPPGEYQDNSIGIPLPGTNTKLSDEGELLISGAYIGRYLEDAGPGDRIPINPPEDKIFWLKTGDLFRKQDNGHFEIIDRLKDIYKNNKGQTIAPRKVEKKFEGVSGIKQTFLVGDARQYNVLLIVPDFTDAVLMNISDPTGLRDYFKQIVTTANQDLAPYERVVNFALVDRDFDVAHDELTPKGSFKRKNIESNFKEIIDELYKSKDVSLQIQDLTIRIPHWFYRDLGILEDVIIVTDTGLKNTQHGFTLTIDKAEKGHVQIGDLEYMLKGSVIDLGIMTRQPKLWVGNGSLIQFCPCREGWDIPVEPFAKLVQLPWKREAINPRLGHIRPAMVTDRSLTMINQMIYYALFDEQDNAIRAIKQMGKSLSELDERIARVVRRRLVTLARHPEFAVRSLAYRTLLMEQPTGDYNEMLPAFIDSGLPFLDDESIQEIARTGLKERRLEALRQRLFQYRTKLTWPASEVTRLQFEHILILLTDFAKYHPEYYDTMRSELAGWILHKVDESLSKKAEKLFTELYTHYETELEKKTRRISQDEWQRKLIFGEELTGTEINRISQVLVDTTFLKQSVILAFDDDKFEINDVADEGIWISRIISRRNHLRYRVSINTTSGKHYDLQLILDEDYSQPVVMETIYWLMNISSYPYGPRVLPRLGCCRLDLHARSLIYNGDLTTWEKVREFSGRGRGTVAVSVPKRTQWRKLIIKSLAAFFKGWRISGKRIVPGAVAPENVYVPEQDFREGASILSLSGWRYYENTLSLVKPMVLNFFKKTAAHYPWCRELIDISWLFDACIEELGMVEGNDFLQQLESDIKAVAGGGEKSWLLRKLELYLRNLGKHYYVPMSLQSAIDRFGEWVAVNPTATMEARGQNVGELYRLYRLDRYPEIVRYHLYRHTAFKRSSQEVLDAFDRLLHRMFKRPDISAIQMIELTELQSSLHQSDERKVFGQMVFPKSHHPQHMEISAVGESGHQYVIVRTTFTDKQNETFTFREPVEPAEIGQLYRLFFKEGYPKTVSERDRFIVVVDNNRQIIGGLCYRNDGEGVVSLDGSVVAGPFMGRGLGSALLEDFCTRMADQGIRVIKTHFFLRRFYSKRGFNVDSKWGALVRFLEPPEDLE
ncbi:MAG: GNAT family N-acetyltransferase [Candidatus Zixiibacteriota bacterium]